MFVFLEYCAIENLGKLIWYDMKWIEATFLHLATQSDIF
jgi:hypothetical protein